MKYLVDLKSEGLTCLAMIRLHDDVDEDPYLAAPEFIERKSSAFPFIHGGVKLV